jgi:hypothetical protein
MRRNARRDAGTCCSCGARRYHRTVWIDLHRRWIFITAVAVAGCSDSESSGKTVGELGNGEFLYRCVNPNDGACEGTSVVFPECILLGGEFEMDYVLHESDAVDDDDFDTFVYVESASQDFFAGQGHYRADRLGRAAFLAREGEQIIDIIHLEIVDAIGIAVSDMDGQPVTGVVEVVRGDTVTLDAYAVTGGCSPVGGGGSVAATSSDPGIATVVADQRVTVEGQEVGRTSIAISSAGFEQVVQIEVLQGAPRRKKPMEDDDSGAEDTTTTAGTSDGGTSDGGTSDGSTDGGSTDDAGTSSGSED